MNLASADYARVERAILFLERNFPRQPSLRDVARSVHLSEHHFHRLFQRWAGISPKRFVQYLTVEHAKQLLRGGDSRSLLQTTYEAGLSSPSRLHDLFVKIEAVTPAEFRRRGAGVSIDFGIHPSPFGDCLLAVTDKGICGLSFVGGGGRARTVADLRANWPEATIREAPAATRPLASRIFTGFSAQTSEQLSLVVKGTNFQIRVWEALLRIPPGSVASYGDIAVEIGNPTALRAVGNAVARNPIGYLIPCHRVIRKSGAIGNYGWGVARKQAMLAWEAAHTQTGRRVDAERFTAVRA